MEELISNIKKELRANMNGVASSRMRESGLNYHVNFGVELPRLQQIAEDAKAHIATQPTAQAREALNAKVSRAVTSLWHENVRESKILAAMLMPTENFASDLADVWVEQIPNAEIAQTTVMYLFSRLPYAADKAFQWMASDSQMLQLCGILLATRLLIQGIAFDERSRQELLDQALSLQDSPNLHLRKAVLNLLARF